MAMGNEEKCRLRMKSIDQRRNQIQWVQAYLKMGEGMWPNDISKARFMAMVKHYTNNQGQINSNKYWD